MMMMMMAVMVVVVFFIQIIIVNRALDYDQHKLSVLCNCGADHYPTGVWPTTTAVPCYTIDLHRRQPKNCLLNTAGENLLNLLLCQSISATLKSRGFFTTLSTTDRLLDTVLLLHSLSCQCWPGLQKTFKALEIRQEKKSLTTSKLATSNFQFDLPRREFDFCMAAGVKEPLGVTWVLLLILVGSLCYWAWTWFRRSYCEFNIPPFPAPRRWFTGHLQLWMGKSEVENIALFREKVGDVFSLDFSGKLVVVVSGYNAIRQVLVKKCHEAANRPTTAATYHLKEDNLGLVHARGENWKVQRTTSLHILREFGLGKNILAERVGNEVREFCNKLAQLNGEPTDFRDLATTSVSNVICSMIIGRRFDHDEPSFVELMKNLNFMFSKAPRLGLLESFPFLRFLPWDFLGTRPWIRSIQFIREDFARAHIKEAKKSFTQENKPSSFINAYLQRMQEVNGKGWSSKLDEENLITNIRGLFIAGTETTSTTIYWCILFCLHRPELQEKIYQQISKFVSHNRLPSLNDQDNLPYLSAVIMETQRYASLVPMLQRKVTENFDLLGFNIPKDSLVILNMRSCLYDSKPWGDPDTFRPERFLDGAGKLLKPPPEFVPFGLGRRSCLGERMAKMELYLFLSAMFQRFRFLPESSFEELPPLRGKLSVILSPQHYRVRFVERASV
ncbi:cytochrome P450 2U1 [Elysia marginata]|uniref:Cytochrome P450 2U1 n=1 Tax=Elysia marginata TaxID=1093978 RepID=A0AAV4G676_9GAST|nr:cytochrome P450 2U1 [Elysia marginata]